MTMRRKVVASEAKYYWLTLSNKRAIMFLSFRLPDAETRYSNSERECFAIVSVLQKSDGWWWVANTQSWYTQINARVCASFGYYWNDHKTMVRFTFRCGPDLQARWPNLATWPLLSFHFLNYRRPYMCGSFLFFSLGDGALLSVYFFAFQDKAQFLNEHLLFLHDTQSVSEALPPWKSSKCKRPFRRLLRIRSHCNFCFIPFILGFVIRCQLRTDGENFSSIYSLPILLFYRGYISILLPSIPDN